MRLLALILTLTSLAAHAGEIVRITGGNGVITVARGGHTHTRTYHEAPAGTPAPRVEHAAPSHHRPHRMFQGRCFPLGHGWLQCRRLNHDFVVHTAAPLRPDPAAATGEPHRWGWWRAKGPPDSGGGPASFCPASR